MSVIDMCEVSRRYDAGPPALENVTLGIEAGESVAILGPSGSGKSTTLNLIAGLDRPDTGTLTVAGVRLNGLSEAASARYRRAKIGMIFQFFNLLDDLTVTDNILLPAQLSGMARIKARQRCANLLESLDIARHAKDYPGRLSGGQRQRVAVARALMNRPALLLADEPTGALDSASGHQVRRLLTELNTQGQTLVLVTHDESLAAQCATRTIRLVDGKVSSDTGTPTSARLGASATTGARSGTGAAQPTGTATGVAQPTGTATGVDR